MFKRFRFLWLVFIPVILLGAYMWRIRFADTVSFRFYGLNEQTFTSVNVYGLSPLGRKLSLHKTYNTCNFSSLGNRTFMYAIVLEIPDSILARTDSIAIETGYEKRTATPANFADYFTSEGTLSGRYHLNTDLHPARASQIFNAWKTWPLLLRRTIAITALTLLLLVLLVYFLRSSTLKPFRSHVLKGIIAFKLRLAGFFKKKAFFKITVFFTLFLALAFAVIMHFGIFCHFSAFVFLFLIYFALLLLTFALNLILKPETISGMRLLLTSLFFGLMVTEAALRFFQVNASYLERNLLCYERVFATYSNSRYYTRTEGLDVDYTTSEFRYFRKIYQGGFTQPLPSAQKDSGEFRILALGDSFTEGVGVSADSTWLKQLERMLSEAYPSKKITTFNAGVVSSDPVFQYVLLTEKFDTLNFDMVIVATNESDQLDIVLRGGFERFQPDGTVKYRERPRWEWLYGLSYMFRLVVINGMGYNHILMQQEAFDARRLEALNILFDTEVKFFSYSARKGIPVVFVFHPTQSEVLNPQYFHLSHIMARLKAQNPEMHIVDLNNYYINTVRMNRDNIFDYFWKIDGHHNAKGYNVFAVCVYNYIKEKGLIPE